MWYLKSAPSNLSSWKNFRKKKKAKFEDQNPLFYQKCLILVFLGWNLKKKKLSYLKSVPSEMSICKFGKKIKLLKCRTKNAWFRYFGTGIWKHYSNIWNPLPLICGIAKFCTKAKMRKFKTENAIFGYFWPKISYLLIFGLEF